MIEEIHFILHVVNGIYIIILNVIWYTYTYSNTNISLFILIFVRKTFFYGMMHVSEFFFKDFYVNFFIKVNNYIQHSMKFTSVFL